MRRTDSFVRYRGRPHGQRHTIVQALGADGIERQLRDAPVNHCLSFEQVNDEIIEQRHIPQGTFDIITDCKYSIPSFPDIGKLYCILIEDCAEPGKEAQELMNIFSSFISDEISDFQSGVHYQNPSYLKCSYQAEYLLDG